MKVRIAKLGLLLTAGVFASCNKTPVNPPEPITRYQIYGNPDKVALLVDSETGTVWRYQPGEKEQFLPIRVVQPSTGDPKVDAFLRSYPSN